MLWTLNALMGGGLVGFFVGARAGRRHPRTEIGMLRTDLRTEIGVLRTERKATSAACTTRSICLPNATPR